MGELANYSIETDQLVWLAFKNGQSLRVPVGQLPRYLTPRDLQKVRRAMKLRRDFFRHNMPPALLMLLVLGLVGMVAAGGQVLALMSRRSAPEPPAPSRSEIVRNVNFATPVLSPAPQPAANRVVAVTRHQTTAVRAKPASVSAPVSPAPPASTAAVPAPVVLPTPSVSLPAPTPIPSPTPVPQPSPTPQPVEPPGQVLGDSTGPDAKLGPL